MEVLLSLQVLLICFKWGFVEKCDWQQQGEQKHEKLESAHSMEHPIVTGL